MLSQKASEFWTVLRNMLVNGIINLMRLESCSGSAWINLEGVEVMKGFWKRTGTGFLAAVCAVSMWTAVCPPLTVSAASTAKTTDYLNLREGPGTSYDVIMTLSNGATVTVLDNSDPDWVKVKTPTGTQG